jgi:hypothetical protein
VDVVVIGHAAGVDHDFDHETRDTFCAAKI